VKYLLGKYIIEEKFYCASLDKSTASWTVVQDGKGILISKVMQ